MKTKENKEVLYEGRKPSDDELFFLQWGKESIKENIKLSDEILGKILSLSIAFTGGGIVQNTIVGSPIKEAIVIVFMVSAIFSLIGIIPKAKKINLANPYDIKIYKENVFKRKRICIWMSSIFLIIGIIICLIGIIIK